MSVFIGYPSFMAYQMMKGKKGNNDDFPSIPGITARYSALGLTNEQMAANPVWVDKTGNGHDLQLKNFAWGGMSGVGGYKFNFKNSPEWNISVVQVKEHNDNRIVINNRLNAVQLFYKGTSIKIVIKLTGVEENNSRLKIYDDIDSSKEQSYNKDGIYEIDYIANDGANYVYFYITGGNYGELDLPITIEQLPLYPGALVFDGVDDYGVCDNFPILTKEKGYTVVALRQRISTGEGICGLVSNVKNWFKDGAFILEYSYTKNSYFNRPVSFGAIGGEKDLPHILTYQTSKSYNGVSIAVGSFIGTDRLYVGKTDNIIGNCTNAAIWELVFLDHDATEEELTKIKDYFVKTYPWLFFDQAWTVTGKTNEDEDRATIANITGNGNDLVLSNFGFAEGSGYGLYAYNFNSFELRDNVVKPTDVKKDSFRIIGIGDNGNVLVLSNTSNSAAWKIRITGMKEGDSCIVGNANKSDDYVKITKDGVYTFQKQYAATSINGIWYNSSQEVDVLVEQIPDYEGYLVTDGVDDEVRSAAFTLNEDWTIVGNWEFITNENKNAGLTKVYSFYLYNRDYGIFVYEYLNARQGFSVEDVKSLKAICSDGRIYLNDWQEIRNNIEQEATISKGVMAIGYFNRDFTKMAFKNLGIYNNQLLSKDDCIKAYNYLQTLKAK